MSFTTPLEVRALDDGRWELVSEFCYYRTDDESCEITVPKGFTTDFASIPRAVWVIYKPYGKTYGKAAVIHDYLYATQKHDGHPIERKWADQVFLEAMKVLGANWFRRTAMYQSVRWFAGAAWEGHKKRLEEEND